MKPYLKFIISVFSLLLVFNVNSSAYFSKYDEKLMLNMMKKVLNEQQFIRSHGYFKSKFTSSIMPKYIRTNSTTFNKQQYFELQVDWYNDNQDYGLILETQDVEYVNHDCKYLKNYLVKCIIHYNVQAFYILNDDITRSGEINNDEFTFIKNLQDKWYISVQDKAFHKKTEKPKY
jgi:hypothetical protein